MNSNQCRRASGLKYITADLQIMPHKGSVSPVWLNPTLWSCHFADNHTVTLEWYVYVVALTWVPANKVGGRCCVWASRNIPWLLPAHSLTTAASRHSHERIYRIRWVFHYIVVQEFTHDDSWIGLCSQNPPHLGPHFNKHISHMQ